MVHSLVPLKVSGLAALAACHYLVEVREKIFTVLYKTINSHQSVKELQEAGKEAMKKVRGKLLDGKEGRIVGWRGRTVGPRDVG